MSHLLAISVGPVQEFIAAARRTRDLWFGSYLLSEVSRAVAKSVEADGAELIFPASSDAESVANVILAELPSGNPIDVANKAKQAAQMRWLAFANEAHREAWRVIDEDIWNEQVNDVIEFYSAWVVRSTDYTADRGMLMRLLAGRKNCRDFEPAHGRAGVAKSSLDGRRESVLKNADRREWPMQLRLSSGEQLDVVGVTKRLGKIKGESVPRYPSVARVAAETWLAGMEKRNALQPLKDACEKLVVKGLNTVREKKYEYFPFEGTVIYKDRLADLQRELGLQESDLNELKAALELNGGDPNPYLAVLVADGDKMGAAISRCDSPAKHRGLSQALAGFAASARRIVNQHCGVLVYAGGDDVLAFLPIDKCLMCARALRDKFVECLAEQVPEDTPTLSVGVAIGHFMENLEDLLEYGRSAERAAKKVESKDTLAVHLHKRSGSPIKIAARWETKPEERLFSLALLMNDGIIPTKLPYELRSLATLYETWSENTAEAIKRDVAYVISKKASKGVTTVKAAMEQFTKNMDSKKLLTLSKEMLVAHQIATALRQAAGRAFVAEEVAS